MSNQLRVVLIFGTYPPMKDGGADFVCNLATKLEQKGVEVYVITTSLISKYHQESPNPNLKILPIIEQWDFKTLNFASLRVFARMLRRINPDIIHLIYPSSYFGNGYKLPFFIKLISRKPLVTTFFSLFKTGSTFFTKIGTFSLMLLSQRLVSHDDEYINFFKKYLFFKKAAFIPVGSNTFDGLSAANNYVCKSELRKKIGLEPNKIYLSFVGQMDISKGIETLLEALHIIISRGFKNVKLIMVGSGDVECRGEEQGYKPELFHYGEKIFALVKKLSLDDYIIWTSYLPPEDYNNYILCSDFCILPFRRNILGRSSLATALTLGVPVITTAGRISKFIPLRHRENVLLVHPDTENKLAKAVIELINSPHLRDKIGRGGKLLSREFSWETIVEKTLKLYCELCS